MEILLIPESEAIFMKSPLDEARSNFYTTLTWEDLEDWAGPRIAARGQDYHHRGLVKDLALSPVGEIIAWVDGSTRYATLVDVEGGYLVSACTCPCEAACKHTVALILTYLEKQKNGQPIPVAKEKDPRLLLLNEIEEDDDEDFEDWDEDGEDFEDEGEFDEVIPETKAKKPKTTTSKKTSPDINSFLEQQIKQELIKLLKDLTIEFPAVLEYLQDRAAAASDHVPQLMKTIRKELLKLGQTPGWQNYWTGEGYTPD
jgi:uncharacterized Zn finger protein